MNIIKIVAVALLAVIVSGCSQIPEGASEPIVYIHDTRTNLCFAQHYGGIATASYAMVLVLCSPSVEQLASHK